LNLHIGFICGIRYNGVKTFFKITPKKKFDVSIFRKKTSM